MKTIIAGGRDFNDYFSLVKVMHSFILVNKIAVHELEIVSGTARGADKLGEQYANEMNIPIKQFPANWGKFGKSAGYIRNTQMAEYADILIAFWDGKSKGTKHMIDLARKHNLTIHIIKY